jgi:hypothetical protein
MLMNNPNRPTFQAQCQAVVAGIAKRIAKPLALSGTTWSPAAMTAALQGAVTDASNTDAAKAAWRIAVAKGKGSRAQAIKLISAIRAYVKATYGSNAADVLADFDFPPPKIRSVSTQTKANSVAQNKATRAARHTLGPKQRQAVKGTIASPAPAAQPSVKPSGT